ncbi:hypothetical protein V1511DRAFT_491712 [Dipodascopsis uninucleata]
MTSKFFSNLKKNPIPDFSKSRKGTNSSSASLNTANADDIVYSDSWSSSDKNISQANLEVKSTASDRPREEHDTQDRNLTPKYTGKLSQLGRSATITFSNKGNANASNRSVATEGYSEPALAEPSYKRVNSKVSDKSFTDDVIIEEGAADSKMIAPSKTSNENMGHMIPKSMQGSLKADISRGVPSLAAVQQMRNPALDTHKARQSRPTSFEASSAASSLVSKAPQAPITNTSIVDRSSQPPPSVMNDAAITSTTGSDAVSTKKFDQEKVLTRNKPFTKPHTLRPTVEEVKSSGVNGSIVEWYSYFDDIYKSYREEMIQQEKRYSELSKEKELLATIAQQERAKREALESDLARKNIESGRNILDDTQYKTKFENLDRSLRSVAFKERSNWDRYPDWIASKDLSKGPMRRAVLARWLVEEVFLKYMHPGLDLTTSKVLKKVERNVGHSFPEDVSLWRRNAIKSTLPPDAIDRQGTLGSLESKKEFNDHRKAALASLEHLCYKVYKKQLVDTQQKKVKDLPAYYIDIIDQALSLIAAMNLEVRCIILHYYLPGSNMDPQFMYEETEDEDEDDQGNGNKTETGLVEKTVKACGFFSVVKYQNNSKFVICRAQVW